MITLNGYTEWLHCVLHWVLHSSQTAKASRLACWQQVHCIRRIRPQSSCSRAWGSSLISFINLVDFTLHNLRSISDLRLIRIVDQTRLLNALVRLGSTAAVVASEDKSLTRAVDVCIVYRTHCCSNERQSRFQQTLPTTFSFSLAMMLSTSE